MNKEELQNDLVNIEQKAESWFMSEIKGNWGKIIIWILVISACIFAYNDVIKYLHKPNGNTIIQQTPSPVNLNANGQQMAKPADIYVNVNPVLGEKSVATVIPKTNNTTPSASITDNQPKFVLKYNGVKYEYVPYTTEQANFDPKSWEFQYTRNTTMDVNVEVPTPRYSIGVGMNIDKSPAIMGTYRMGNTPFNVWGYASSKDQAIGLNFTQYATNPSKKGGEIKK